jgi:hypothetical protein
MSVDIESAKQLLKMYFGGVAPHNNPRIWFIRRQGRAGTNGARFFTVPVGHASSWIEDITSLVARVVDAKVDKWYLKTNDPSNVVALLSIKLYNDPNVVKGRDL